MKLYQVYSRKKKRLSFIFILVSMMLLFLPRPKIFSQQEGLPKEQIVQKALSAFEKKEGKIKERVIIYDIANGKWLEKFKTINKEMAQKFVVLGNKDYQAICFTIKPKPGLKGKNTWVFIDRFTGEVLALYVE